MAKKKPTPVEDRDYSSILVTPYAKHPQNVGRFPADILVTATMSTVSPTLDLTITNEETGKKTRVYLGCQEAQALHQLIGSKIKQTWG